MCNMMQDIYKRDMTACAGHESFGSIDHADIDSMPGDSDYDSDDETFESVSLVSYSAYNSEGDLETAEYFPFVCYDDIERPRGRNERRSPDGIAHLPGHFRHMVLLRSMVDFTSCDENSALNINM